MPRLKEALRRNCDLFLLFKRMEVVPQSIFWQETFTLVNYWMCLMPVL